MTAREELFGKRSLSVGLPALDLPFDGDVEPDGVLESVPIVPGIASVNVYGSWLRWLEDEFDDEVSVVTFPYDWRRDNTTSAKHLHDRVQELRSDGAAQIVIVAHSMGGLIASYFLRYGDAEASAAAETWRGAELVDGVVFLGTPFLGSASVFRDFQIGAVNMFNTHLLNQLALSTFPSAYQLLPPSHGRMLLAADGRMLLAADGRTLQATIFAADTWIDGRWGLFKTPNLSAAAKQARTDYLQQQLDRAAQLSRLLHAPLAHPPTEPLPILNIYGDAEPTFSYVFTRPSTPSRLAYNEATLEREFPTQPSSALMSVGDGVVSALSAQLPVALQEASVQTTVTTSFSHVELGNDPVVRQRMAAFLRGIVDGGRRRQRD